MTRTDPNRSSNGPAASASTPVIANRDSETFTSVRVQPNSSSNGVIKTPKEYWRMPTVNVKHVNRTEAITQP